MYKSGYAVILGRPNVGKSTLMNHLIGMKVAITSRKPQTTRSRQATVLTEDEGQVIFLDTPGVIKKSGNKLGDYMKGEYAGSLSEADVALWVVEPKSYIGPADEEIAGMLKGCGTPVILVVNKADTVKKEALAEVIEAFSAECGFADAVCVSALKGTNLKALKECIFKNLPEGPQYYDEETVTETPVRDMCAEIIREKALRCLGEEVPHGIAVVVESFKERREGLTDIEAAVICEKDSHKGIIIGKGGAMLKKIGQAARTDIEELVGTKVYLKLFVKVRKNWRDSMSDLKNFGYSKK